MMRRLMRLVASGLAILVCWHMSGAVAGWKQDRETLFRDGKRTPAIVRRVIDADTVEVDVRPWLDISVEGVDVRIAGIDTPEKVGTGCTMHPLWRGKSVPDEVKAHENLLGCRATAFVAGTDGVKSKKCMALLKGEARQAGLLHPGDPVILTEIHGGKYYGRVVGDLLYPIEGTKDPVVWQSLAMKLYSEDMAVIYGAKLKDGRLIEDRNALTKGAWWCDGKTAKPPEGERN
ncbi:hypothetical protein [uncultured Cohaesibacter sp.]|uniref:hypothetical protein n=1 Tax=uncultured Cohaesibacter sp. TaxID=1002546 RepID=UPI0029C65DEA|nr:hypothetical protein [uncultured Cohaesibacter sp.]